MLKIEYIKQETKVYDITVADNHNFYANDILVHNCAEILLPTKPLQSLDDPNGEIALCSLSAINLGNVKSLDDLESICRNAVRGLDNLLDFQDYMVPAAYTSTMKYRPLGIGIINLAYYFAKNGVKYGEPAANQLIHDTMEAIQFYCIKASIDLAKERGAIPGLADTKYGDGLFPIDHYNKNVDEIVKPKYNLDWKWLRGELKKYGIRNSTLTAMMPAESSARISNATNGVEPVRSLITTKTNKSHISKQVVPEYNRLKNKYDLVWEMKSNDGVIKTMAVITKFIDQSISTNNNYNPANYENGDIPLSVLLKDLLTCNKYGLRTLYYLNTNDQRDEEVVDTVPEQVEEHADEACDSCTI